MITRCDIDIENSFKGDAISLNGHHEVEMSSVLALHLIRDGTDLTLIKEFLDQIGFIILDFPEMNDEKETEGFGKIIVIEGSIDRLRDAIDLFSPTWSELLPLVASIQGNDGRYLFLRPLSSECVDDSKKEPRNRVTKMTKVSEPSLKRIIRNPNCIVFESDTDSDGGEKVITRYGLDGRVEIRYGFQKN